MSTPDIFEPEPVPRPFWRRPLPRVVFALLLLAVVGVAGSYAYVRYRDGRELAAAIAETDALDPGWRLDDLDARRKDIPDEENAALVVMQIKAGLPPVWPPRPAEEPGEVLNRPALDQRLGDVPPEAQLSPEDAKELREELKKVEAALAKARALERLREGRFPLKWSKDFISTTVKCQDAREVARLLQADATARAQDGDADGALESGRAILIAGRSIGDEPLLMSQLVRMAIASVAVASIERTLAQGQPSECALAKTQQLLQDEEQVPRLLIAARGERAGQDHMARGVESGEVKLSVMLGAAGGGGPPSGIQASLTDLSGGITFRRYHSEMLRRMTEVVEAAKLPPEERADRLTKLDQAVKGPGVHPLVRLLLPAVSKVAQADQRVQAQLRCAAAALAAERYRLAKGRWPPALADLVPDYLAQVPNDPYDGQPLRLRRLDDGLVIYSVGPDLADNGGTLDRKNPIAKGTDLGFRLWDVPRRWQPPMKAGAGQAAAQP